MGKPYSPTGSYKDDSGVGWQSTFVTIGGLSCNGPIYNSQLVAIYHYQTYAEGTQIAVGTSTGPTIRCTNSCTNIEASYVRRRMACKTHYSWDDYGQLTGFWQQTATSAKVNVSVDSLHTPGAAYLPYPC